MPRKNFQQKPNFRQIARDLNISATTLYQKNDRHLRFRLYCPH